MKKMIGMLAVAFCLVGCSKGPDKVAVNFMESIRDGKFEKAVEYAAKDSKPLIAFISQMPKDKRDELAGVEFNAVDTKIDGDTAKVKLEGSKDGKTKTNEVDLVKEDGEWKVQMKKN